MAMRSSGGSAEADGRVGELRRLRVDGHGVVGDGVVAGDVDDDARGDVREHVRDDERRDGDADREVDGVEENVALKRFRKRAAAARLRTVPRHHVRLHAQQHTQLGKKKTRKPKF